MDNKVLIKLVVPELDSSFDIFVPVNEVVWKVKKMIIKCLNDITNSNFDILGKEKTAMFVIVPDEVKNLHYKAIIFPNFGYSIFRDTVGYPKLSCYSSGELKRTINPLENLNHTYFTVEMIEVEEEPSIHSIRSRRNNINNVSSNSTFKEVERVLEVILKDVVYEVLYKQNSNEKYLLIQSSEIKSSDLFKIKTKLSRNKYNLIIDKNDNMTSIEVHFKE